MNGLKLAPVNPQSELILQKGEFAFIGISPFSSYFSVERIAQILSAVISDFDNFAIFIPDKISKFTLEALGYETGINQKVRRQDNYLRNKAQLALKIVGDYKSDKIVSLSDLLNNEQYLQSYRKVTDTFNKDEHFMQGCIRTSKDILSNHSNSSNLTLGTNSLLIGVQYFLQELPVFLKAPEILNVSSCCFTYPAIPVFLRVIYNDYSGLVSKNQGFATF